MKLEEVKNLYNQFLIGTPLPSEKNQEGESFYFDVIHIDERSMALIGLEKYNKNESYFKAEFGFHYKHTNFCIGHNFKLDIQQIEMEMEKITGNKIILNPTEDIALVLTHTYPEAHIFLACFNNTGENDYIEIAKLIINYRGLRASKKFGF